MQNASPILAPITWGSIQLRQPVAEIAPCLERGRRLSNLVASTLLGLQSVGMPVLDVTCFRWLGVRGAAWSLRILCRTSMAACGLHAYGKGVFAEFERALIQERIRAGLALARKSGTKTGLAIGRPKASAEIESRIRELRAQGIGIKKIASQVPRGVSVVQRLLAGHELKT